MEVREGTRSYRDRADEWQAGGAWRRTEPVPAQQSRRGRTMDPRRLARGLGWFSLSLGLVEVLAPRFVSRLIGGRGDNTGLIRLYGVREIMSGMMIFGQGAKPAVGLWSRVAGDAIDIATLAAAASSSSTRKGPLAFATANVLGVTALDVYCAQELGRRQPALSAGTIRMSRSVLLISATSLRTACDSSSGFATACLMTPMLTAGLPMKRAITRRSTGATCARPMSRMRTG